MKLARWEPGQEVGGLSALGLFPLFRNDRRPLSEDVFCEVVQDPAHPDVLKFLPSVLFWCQEALVQSTDLGRGGAGTLGDSLRVSTSAGRG